MIKLRVAYQDNTELQTIINLLSINYKPVKISKEYHPKGESQHKKVYVELENK